MPSVKGICKICRRVAIASWPDHAPQNAVDKWLPLLTCNRCYDLYSKRRQSFETIVGECFRYHYAPNKGRIIAEVRGMLELATRSYAEAIQGILNAPEVIWSQGFVDVLVEKPEQCGEILSRYREEVRQSCRRVSYEHDPA